MYHISLQSVSLQEVCSDSTVLPILRLLMSTSIKSCIVLGLSWCFLHLECQKFDEIRIYCTGPHCKQGWNFFVNLKFSEQNFFTIEIWARVLSVQFRGLDHSGGLWVETFVCRQANSWVCERMSKQCSSVDSYSDGEIFESREECETPKHGGHKIPDMSCPSPPKKKKPMLKSRDPPSTGYFNPPDLDILFAKMSRRAYV
eukprot:Gb_39903 [translate_table: standard]